MAVVKGLPVARPSSSWPTYAPEQLNQYFKTIKLPNKYLQHPIAKDKTIDGSSDDEALHFLKQLILHHISAIPFENLELHYSTGRTVSVDPQHLFSKIIDRQCGRGGFGIESTYLFATVLRSLGYSVVCTGARLNRVVQPTKQRSSDGSQTYDAWNHMVAIVTVGKQKYLVDVGFGNNSITLPVPLYDGYVGSNGRPSHQIRLYRDKIPNFVPEGIRETPVAQSMWVYSVRSTDQPESDHVWIPAYCFSEIEFQPQNFAAMCTYIAKHPKSWFTQQIVCTKFLIDKRAQEIIGDITLYKGNIKERKRGVTTILAQCRNEKDRVKAMRKYLGVKLSDNEKNAIVGTPTMIK